MFTLTKCLQNHITVDDKNFKLDLNFDTVLLAFELLDDPDYFEYEKTELLFMMFCGVNSTEGYEYQTMLDAVNYIFNEIINKRLFTSGNEKVSVTPILNFKYDASFIFASFMKDYNIDLFECMGIMRWEKFISLFNGLSDDTIIRKVMDIRGKPIPIPTKHNSEQIKALRDLKYKYDLRNVMTVEELAKHNEQINDNQSPLSRLCDMADRYGGKRWKK